MKLRFLWLTVAAGLVIAGTGIPARADVGLTVTPAAISNTYPGTIVLTITGLTNFQQVKVQTYMDLNGNGLVDAGEPLMDVFNLTESRVTTVGGITNLNLPYDSNPSTSAITASLSFAPPLENLCGQRIYRVVSSSGSVFPAATEVLSVTNAVLGQAVSGVVYSNGLTPLPNAVVVVLTETNENYVAGTIADAAGHYYLSLSPGAYVVIPTMPGYYTDLSRAPLVTMTSGVDVTNDLTLTNGVVTIGGAVADVSNTNTLGGIFLQASSGDLLTIGFTGTNGYYALGATTNIWKVKTPAERLARRGYLAAQNYALSVDTTLGSVTNAYLGLYRGNNLLYGQITVSNQPVANVAVEANDSLQLSVSKGYTDANGNYAVAVLENTNIFPAGTTWYCSPSPNGQWSLFANFIFNQGNRLSFGSNLVDRVDFVGLPVTTTLSGRLVNNLGVPLASVAVGGTATINGLQYATTYVNTDTNGGFTVNATAGNWYLNANCCGSYSLAGLGYYQLAAVLVSVPPAVAGINLVAYPASQPQLGPPLHAVGSRFDATLYGASGNNYTIQAKTNLAATNWFTVTVVSNLPVSPYFIEDSQATNPARFYRVVPGP